MANMFESIFFSKLKKHNFDVKVVCSPNASSLVYAVQKDLVIESLKSGENQSRFVCDGIIDYISCSPDSELICCGILKNNCIQVWSTVDLSWRCKISEGLLKIADIMWAPDSRHLIVSSELAFRMAVWSLSPAECTVIKNAKYCKNCISFSNCSTYMAVLQRKMFADFIEIYSCSNWQPLKCFPIDTENAADIHFSSSDPIIAVLESLSEEPKVLFYSIDGRLIHAYSKVDHLLGMTAFSWSPKSNFVVLGDYYEMVTFLNGRSCKEIIQFNLSISKQTNVYKLAETVSSASKITNNVTKYEIVSERPFMLTPFIESKNRISKKGIQILQFSKDERYVAIVGNTTTNAVFIFNMRTLKLSDVVVHNAKIKSIAWHPDKPILAFCCSNSFVELWMPIGCVRLVSPYEDSLVLKCVEWSPNGNSLILNGKDNFALLNQIDVNVNNFRCH